jgi:hypothetical protein
VGSYENRCGATLLNYRQNDDEPYQEEAEGCQRYNETKRYGAEGPPSLCPVPHKAFKIETPLGTPKWSRPEGQPKSLDEMQVIEKDGRGERIRTSDPLVPNQVLYQAEPLPELAVGRTFTGRKAPG